MNISIRPVDSAARISTEYQDLLETLECNIFDLGAEGQRLGQIRTFVASGEDGDYLGTASLEIHRRSRKGLLGHVTNVVVREELRGQGIGSMLMRHVIGVAKSVNCKNVDLMCEDRNVSFYVRFGFKSIGGNRMVLDL